MLVISAKENLHLTVELEGNPHFPSHSADTRAKMSGTLVVLYRKRQVVNWWYYTERDPNEGHTDVAIQREVPLGVPQQRPYAERAIIMSGTSNCTQDLPVHR
jgi:hypothetical protein